MGNANGREEASVGGGGDDPLVRSNGGGGVRANDALSLRVPSSDLMANSPPDSPRLSRSPVLFAPQVTSLCASITHIVVFACFCVHICVSALLWMNIPAVPLQGDCPPLFNNTRQDEPEDEIDYSPEPGIPILITWSYGGNNVAVEGSWDSWRTRKTLQRSGKDHTILMVLPSGIYHYKFIVDGEERYIPELPHEADDMNHVHNLLDVNDYVPENPASVAEFEAPPSPDSSYSQAFPGDEDFAKDPVIVPPHLQLTADTEHSGDTSPSSSSSKPQHVVLNHLFIEKGWASQSMVALGLTHRIRSKYVTVVLYKPLKR